VWSSERPLVLEELGSHFVRAEIAKASGIGAAVGFPLFRGTELTAVVVLLCGRRDKSAGCIEVWNANAELGLLEHAGGYYGRLEQFGRLSRLLQFQAGTGLPGLAWQRGLPQVIEREGRSNAFVRAAIARDYGIEAGIAIPVFRGHEVLHVIVLLSTGSTPIARAFEVWVPDGGALSLSAHHYASGLESFAAASENLRFKSGEGLPGRAFASGLPVVFDWLKAPGFLRERAACDAGLSSGVGIPVLDGGSVSAVACLLC
jgi:putative methionine-R-sulfoxide reductase with GAF domain